MFLDQSLMNSFSSFFICLFTVHKATVCVLFHHLAPCKPTELTKPITTVDDRVIEDLSIAKDKIGIWKRNAKQLIFDIFIDFLKVQINEVHHQSLPIDYKTKSY